MQSRSENEHRTYIAVEQLYLQQTKKTNKQTKNEIEKTWVKMKR